MKSNRWIIIITSAIVVVILLAGAAAAGFFVGRTMAPGGESLYKPFWQAWNFVNTQYVDQPVDQVKLMRGAIKGMLDSLGDEHTTYTDPELAKEFNAQLNGQQYEGIGAWVDIRGAYLTIISPMANSPAEKAGLKTGDQVVAIDGKDMAGLNGEQVRQKVLGPKGTTVTLTIQRKGVEKPFDVQVTRDSITSPTIEGRMLDNNIAYIHLYSFGENTDNDLKKLLTDLMAKNPQGMILDLRNNGGGYLDTAVMVVSQYVDSGVVMLEEYGDGTRKPYSATGNGLATKIPLVVLVNEGSASASEITAGAIQDLGRGQLVGAKTYGKGTVQRVVPLTNDQGEIRVTIARWLTPKGHQINKVGLEPDFTVTFTDDDIKNNRDPQLEKAIELLTK
jgi:carboxyl-terminal processing protease